MVAKTLKKPNERETRFIEAYLVDPNGTQAAIKAGYSTRTAKSIAEELLKKPHIAAALEAARTARSERTKVDADWVLTRLVDGVKADLKDLFDDRGQLLPVAAWPEVWRTGLVIGVESFEEYEYEGRGKKRHRVATGMVRKVRLTDRIKHVELIGKHVDVRAFREQMELLLPKGTVRDLTGRKPAAAG